LRSFRRIYVLGVLVVLLLLLSRTLMIALLLRALLVMLILVSLRTKLLLLLLILLSLRAVLLLNCVLLVRMINTLLMLSISIITWILLFSNGWATSLIISSAALILLLTDTTSHHIRRKWPCTHALLLRSIRVLDLILDFVSWARRVAYKVCRKTILRSMITVASSQTLSSWVSFAHHASLGSYWRSRIRSIMKSTSLRRCRAAMMRKASAMTAHNRWAHSKLRIFVWVAFGILVVSFAWNSLSNIWWIDNRVLRLIDSRVPWRTAIMALISKGI